MLGGVLVSLVAKGKYPGPVSRMQDPRVDFAVLNAKMELCLRRVKSVATALGPPLLLLFRSAFDGLVRPNEPGFPIRSK